MTKKTKSNLPLTMPVLVGFEENGSWYGLDYQDAKLLIGYADEEGEVINKVSFLEFARMVSERQMCYFYPNAAKDSDKLQTILCNKDSMMSQMKGKNSMVYCVENDRIYCFSKDDHIIVDCETAFKEDLPNDSLYVMHPMTDLWGKTTSD